MKAYREYVGNAHIHSVYSDGHATHQEIARAAREANLNFVIVTDHNVWVREMTGYYNNVLVLVGEELHNVRRQPQANHLLAYDTQHEMAPYAFSSSQTLIQAVRARDGFCYLAHPVEKSSPLRRDTESIPWVDWPVEGITGIELWNYMSEFKGLLWSLLPALIYAFHPDWGIRGPYRKTLKLWDELLNKGQHLAVIGGSDAHGTRYHWGPISRTLFPYKYLFRCVNTHILTTEALMGDAERDKDLIYEALRAGRTWVGYDLPHSTRGFRFHVRSGSAQATVGEELKRLGAVTIHVNLPASGEIHLIHDGKRIQKASGGEMQYTSVEPGIYRVEVYRRYKGRKIGWIFSSPVYVV